MGKKKILFYSLTSAVLLGTTVLVGSNGLKSYVHGDEGNVWNHYDRLAATSEHNGCKEYWVNCNTHETVFAHPGGTPVEQGAATEAFADSLEENDLRVIAKREAPHTHAFDSNYICTVCGATNLLMYNTGSFIREPSKLTETVETAPAGFNKVYSYTGTCGADIGTNSFFMSNLSLAQYTHITFAILHTSANPIKLRCGSGSWYQYSLKAVTSDTWVTIDAKKDSSGTWTISNDLGLFTRADAVTSHTYTATGANVYNLFFPVASDSIKITEVLVDSMTSKHVHNFDGTGVCTKCGFKQLDYLGESSVLRDKTKISKSGIHAPAGFENFYYYDEAVNTSGASSFFINNNATGLSSATEFRLAVLQRQGNEIYLQNPEGNYYSYRFPTTAWNLWGWSEKSNIIYITGTKTGDNQWTITNSISNFRQNGTTTDVSSLVITPAYANYWNYVFRFTWTNAYITEILYK